MIFQDVKFWFYTVLFRWAQDPIVIIISIAVATLLFYSALMDWKNRIRAITLIIVTGMSAFYGARILHVLIERPELLKTPEVIWSRYDGMTFNGSLLFGGLTFFLGSLLFSQDLRTKLWNQAVLATAFSYGMLRLACFTKGCCWGKISGVPWAVKYYHSNLMPWHGLPVHPVQLYDALLGFLVFAVLFHYRKSQASIVPYFFILYATGRFFTEFFRGDSFRGENLILSLSTSQLVSVGLFLGAVFCLLKNKRRVLLVPVAFLITGCWPQAPQKSEFRKVQYEERFEIYQTYKSKDTAIKNVIFVAADDNIQFGFSTYLKKVYPDNPRPRLEDIVFWQYVSDMKSIYNKILRIPYENVGYESLMKALQYMESLNEPYDLILLTHGMPNHISTGRGYFFSYRELESLQGGLPHLNLVMLQSCFGNSLAQDFLKAGAKAVLSYDGFNRNFFFFGFYLRYYYPGSTVESAYYSALRNYDFEMTKFPYWQIERVLKQKNTPVEMPRLHY